MASQEVSLIRTLVRANTSLKPDKKLLNSKFEQYKYTSGKEHDITYTELLHRPHRIKQPDSDYSYQMTRTSCLFNHLLVLDEPINFLYFTSSCPHTYQLRDATNQSDNSGGVVHEFTNDEDLMFNISARWSGIDMRLIVCLGSDLYVLVFGGGSSSSIAAVESVTKQKMECQTLLLGCFHRDEAVHLVTCIKSGDVFIHQILREKEDGKFGVIGKIRMSGIARFVSAKDDLLTIISEGKVHPTVEQESPAVEGVTAVAPPLKHREPTNNYTWTQTMEDVEVSVDLPNGILKTDLVVEISLEHLEIRTKGGQELFKSKLFSKVEPKESSWLISSDKKKLEVSMTKFQSAHNWAHLLKTPGYDPSGNLLGEISDLNEEELRQMLGRMQSLDQYTSDKVDNSPLYTPSKELEECDELDGQQVLVSGFELSPPSDIITQRDVIKQRYLVELSPGSLLFSREDHGFVVSHSVDACYYSPDSLDHPWKHSGTFHAFNMVQATKTQKKFMVTDESLKYAAIVDISRHVYIYCSQRDSCTGKLLVMTLDNDDSEILGVYQKTDKIVLLTEKNLISIKFSL